MSAQFREKIALFVFLALLVLGLGGLGSYLVAGHSWNVAASHLDDTFGSMEGYVAIVYPGTVVEAPAKKDGGTATSKQDVGEGEADDKYTSKVKPESDAPAKASATEEVVDSAYGADDKDSSRVIDDGVRNVAVEKSATEEAFAKPYESDSPINSDAPDDDAASDRLAKVKGGGTLPTPKPKKTLSVQEAKEDYEDKGATVFALDTLDSSAYSEGVILQKNGHRFGVFSIAGPTSSMVLKKQIAYFTRHEVDFIVLVTPDKKYAENVSGISIVVSTQDEDLFVMGETIDGTFYVDTPTVGSVGAILISPSNVVSAKVLQAS